MTISTQAAHRSALQTVCPVGRHVVGVGRDQELRLGQFRFFHLQVAELETGDRLRNVALPDRDGLIAVGAFADQAARGGDLHPFRDAKGQVIAGVFPERSAGSAGIPVLARDRIVVAVAFVG